MTTRNENKFQMTCHLVINLCTVRGFYVRAPLCCIRKVYPACVSVVPSLPSSWFLLCRRRRSPSPTRIILATLLIACVVASLGSHVDTVIRLLRVYYFAWAGLVAHAPTSCLVVLIAGICFAISALHVHYCTPTGSVPRFTRVVLGGGSDRSNDIQWSMLSACTVISLPSSERTPLLYCGTVTSVPPDHVNSGGDSRLAVVDVLLSVLAPRLPSRSLVPLVRLHKLKRENHLHRSLGNLAHQAGIGCYLHAFCRSRHFPGA